MSILTKGVSKYACFHRRNGIFCSLPPDMPTWKKGIALFSAAIVVFLLIIAYSACVKDKCGSTICYNGGVCVQAVCTCKDGFEGVNCERKWSDKFLGKWHADDVYTNDTMHHRYELEIGGTVDNDSFIVYHFTDSINVLCSKTSYLKFAFIPNQKTDTFFILTEGFGTCNDAGKIVTGLYSFTRRTLINDSTAKDTLITTKFTWTR